MFYLLCAFVHLTLCPADVVFFCLQQVYNLKYLYVKHVYGWNSEYLGYYMSLLFVTRAITLLLILPSAFTLLFIVAPLNVAQRYSRVLRAQAASGRRIDARPCFRDSFRPCRGRNLLFHRCDGQRARRFLANIVTGALHLFHLAQLYHVRRQPGPTLAWCRIAAGDG
jgi:hypothetical protein